MHKLSSVIRTCALTVLLTGFAGYLQSAHAQDQDEQPVLPDLAPREVEIRGQLQISFPSLRRQPLVGFNPPPRVPEIPLDRKPGLESYDDAGAVIAKTPLEKPDPPGIAALSGESPFWAEAEVGTGRYFTRLVRGVAAREFGSGRRLGVSLRYEGSDGHSVRSAPDDIKNVSDNLAASAAYSIKKEHLAMNVGASGYISSYSLFGIDTSSGGSVQVNPDRDGRHGTFRVGIGSGTASPISFYLGAALGRSKYSSDLFPSESIIDPSTERTEKRAAVDVSVMFPAGAASGYVEGTASWAGLDSDGLVGSDLKHVQAGAGITRRSDRMNLRVGPRLLTIGYSADAGGVTGDDRNATYLSADVDVSYRYGDVLTLIGANRPTVRTNSLADLFAENPYLVNEPSMQPSIFDVNAEAGLLFSSGPVQFKASVTLKQSPNWRYFVGSAGSGAATVTEGFFETAYGEGRVTSVGGEMAISLPAQLQLSSTVYVHDTELTNLGVQIPYHPRLSGQVGLSFPFASRRGIVQVTGQFIGERYTDVSETSSAERYLDLDVYARYDIRPRIGLVVRLQNLGINDHEVWDNYPQSPSIFMAGVRVLW